jgi:hypothetical protein
MRSCMSVYVKRSRWSLPLTVMALRAGSVLLRVVGNSWFKNMHDIVVAFSAALLGLGVAQPSLSESPYHQST